MFFVVFPSLTFALTINNTTNSYFSTKLLKVIFDKHTNGFCPTFSLDQTVITSICSTNAMYFTNGYDPAYIIDSSKNTITFEIQYCNFSSYKLTSTTMYSLIHITGSKSVYLNVIKCNFEENKFPHSSGIFYTSKGDHIINIRNSNFIHNEGSDSTILSDTCSSLTMSNCYIAYNKCNSFNGQIHLKAKSNTYNENSKSNNKKKHKCKSNFIHKSYIFVK